MPDHKGMHMKIKIENLTQDDVDEMVDMILDLFIQGTALWDTNEARYDHSCISSYENAQEWLIKHGIVQPHECERP